MSKMIKYLIAGAVLLVGLLIFTGNRACNLYDENSILKGRDIELTAQLDEETLKRKVRERDVKMFLERLNKAVLEKTEIIEAANKVTDAAIGQLRTVGELKANAVNDKALIVEMELEIGKRDELIDKLVFTISQQEKRYFSLTKAYNVALKELGLSNLFIVDQKKLLDLKDVRIRGLEKSLKGVRFSSDLKTGVAVALAVTVIYGLVT